MASTSAGWAYQYDANGNPSAALRAGMTRRDPPGTDYYDFVYDAENRITQAKKNGAVIATMVYDGDGNRVKGTVNGATTAYIGDQFEWTGSTSTMKKYYYSGATRIAVRTGAGTGETGLLWLFGDHLGSTSRVANADGSSHSQQRYKPWGEARYVSGTLPTTYRFTGQRQEDYIKLYWIGSRWYDDALGRFVSPDSIVPGVGEGGNQNAVGYSGASTYSPLIVDYHEGLLLDQLNNENRTRLQKPDFRLPPVPTNTVLFDRYAYVMNNPLRYTDPSGHCIWDLCILEIAGVSLGLVELGGIALAVALATPQGREATTKVIGHKLRLGRTCQERRNEFQR